MSKESKQSSSSQRLMPWSSEEADESCQESDSKQKFVQNSVT